MRPLGFRPRRVDATVDQRRAGHVARQIRVARAGKYVITQAFGQTTTRTDLGGAVGCRFCRRSRRGPPTSMSCTKCSPTAEFPQPGHSHRRPHRHQRPGLGFGYGNHVVVRYAWNDLPTTMRTALTNLSLRRLRLRYPTPFQPHRRSRGAVVGVGDVARPARHDRQRVGAASASRNSAQLRRQRTSLFNRVRDRPVANMYQL